MDRISFLPDYLLHHIFSSLNSVILVRCSVLSKRWRYLWISMPFLNFAYTIPFNVKNMFDENAYFNRFVLRVLSHRSSLCEIKKLSFIISMIDTAFGNQLFYFAAFHRVQKLSFSMVCIDHTFFDKLAETRFESLKSLKIHRSLPRVPLNIEYILSGCPNLEYFALRSFFAASVKINLVKLEHLELCSIFVDNKEREIELFTPKLITLRLEDYIPVLKCGVSLSGLKEVELQMSGYRNPRTMRQIAKQLIQSLIVLRNVESLTLSELYVEVFSFIPSSSVAPHDVLNNLRHLKLKSNKRRITMPSHLLNFLLKGPSLETFVIEYSHWFKTIFSTDD